MKTKSILLAYATRFGSTQEVAEKISAVLQEAGLEVDMKPMADVKTLDVYDAVVLGAAIYNAHWHPDAHKFLSQHQEAIQPVACGDFHARPTEHLAMQPERNSHRQLDKELARYPWLKPVAVEIFAGKYDPSKPGLSFFERFIPAHDYRNWDAIRTWANALARAVTSQ